MRPLPPRLSLLVTAALALTPLPASGADSSRAVMISLDGAGERFIEREMAAGRMPNLAAIKRQGVQADYALTNFPSKTAAGHASLWTGTYGSTNGVTANEVPLLPRAEHTILESQSGFLSGALRAEPIWTTAARAGKLAVAVQATHLMPFDTYGPTGRYGLEAASRLMLFDRYSAISESDWMLDSTASLRPATGWVDLPAGSSPPYEASLRAGDTPLFAAIYDDPSDPTQGYDTVEIRTRKDSAVGAEVLKPGRSSWGTTDHFSAAIPVTARGHLTTTRFRLFDLAPDLDAIRLYRSAIAEDLSNHGELMPELLAHTGGPIAKGAEGLYARGKLGRTLVDGGDGLAEDRLLETIRLAIDNQIARLRYCSTRLPWDLLIDYLPYPDAIEHVWTGLIAPESPAYRKDIAPRLAHDMDLVAGMVDEFIGAARGVAGDRAALAVVSDHGMEGLSRDFCPNVALRHAGLLALDADGHVDLSRTKAYYSGCNGAYVVLNTTDRKEGIVSPSQVPAVIERVVTTLRSLKDPATQRPLVSAIYQAAMADASLGLGGPAGGDLYLDVIPGLYLSAAFAADKLLVDRSPYESGSHLFNPTRPSMHAILYLCGPGVRRGATIGPVRTIDVAPTLCHLMGIPAPAQATGRVLVEALQ